MVPRGFKVKRRNIYDKCLKSYSVIFLFVTEKLSLKFMENKEMACFKTQYMTEKK